MLSRFFLALRPRLPRKPSAARLPTGLLITFLLTLLSCTAPDRTASPGYQRVMSFTDGEVVSWTEAPDVYRQVEIFEWRFETAEDLAPWQLQHTRFEPKADSSGFHIRTQTDEPTWIQREDLELDASAVHVVEVERRGTRSKLALLWSRRGVVFHAERGSYQRGAREMGQDIHRQVFPVSRHPQWQGPIERLRLNPARKDDTDQEIIRIRGLRRELDAERLALYVSRAFHQEFDQDSRLSIFAPPGFEHTRSVQRLPVGSILSFATALQQTTGPAIRFVVDIEQDGSRASIFDRTLNPGEHGEAWHEAQVDLSAYAGRDVKLILRTEGAGPETLIDGLPLWGLPQVRAPAGAAQRPNVVLVVADTLRHDRMSLYGHERPTTPNLDAWATRRAVVFEQAVAAAPWTLPAHASMLTGLDAARHGANFSRPIPGDLNLLAERLRREGYTTLAYTGSGYMGPAFGWTRGFDRFVHTTGLSKDQTRREDIATYLPDLLEQIPQTAGPFFLFVHTYETHSPYYPRLDWLRRNTPDLANLDKLDSMVPFDIKTPTRTEEDHWRNTASAVRPDTTPVAPEDLETFRAVYDSGVAYMDSQIGRVLKTFQSTGLEQNSLIIFTSDHGEGLLEPHGDAKGLAGHAYLYDFNLRIPMVVALPSGAGAGGRVGAQVRQVDIVPTVLEVLDLEAGSTLDGESLLPFWQSPDGQAPRVAASYAPSSNYGASLRLDRGYKYILEHAPWASIEGERRLYDLHRDPGELTDASAENPELVRQLDEALRRRLEESICRLEATFNNGTAAPWRVTLDAASIKVDTLKTLAPPCDGCRRWDGRRAEIEVPPGGREVLWWTGPFYGETVVTSEGVDPVQASSSELAGGRDLEHSWPDGRRLLVRRQGNDCPWDAQPGQAPVPIDEETRKQLEALGYLTN